MRMFAVLAEPTGNVFLRPRKARIQGSPLELYRVNWHIHMAGFAMVNMPCPRLLDKPVISCSRLRG